jgi:hypothetical protein
MPTLAVNLAVETKRKILEERKAAELFDERLKTATADRAGDQAGMFKRGLRGYVTQTLVRQDVLSERDERVIQYEPITADDLRVTRTRDWESARRRVFKTKGSRAIGGMGIIPYIDFASKQLTTIPMELMRRIPVERVNLGYNQIANISGQFFNLPVLTELNMDSNELRDIPAAFAYLSRLRVLSLKNNKLERVNYNFCSITTLEELALSSNFLTTLPQFWGRHICPLFAPRVNLDAVSDRFRLAYTRLAI